MVEVSEKFSLHPSVKKATFFPVYSCSVIFRLQNERQR
jgi:hypothetical protein